MENMLNGSTFAYFVIVAKLLHNVVFGLPSHLDRHDRPGTAIVFGDDAYALVDKLQHV